MIPLNEYVSRRRKVEKALKGATGIVFAGNRDNTCSNTWRPHAFFEYLTGITNEPGAILLFDPSNPLKARNEILFLAVRNPEMEQWEGLRKSLGSALRKEVGVPTILRTLSLSFVISDIVARNKTCATLMPTANIDSPISKDMELWQQVSQRTPSVEIIDSTLIIPTLRSVKSLAEIKIIQEAVDMTARGFRDAMKFVCAGVNEYQVQATLEFGYAMSGGHGSAFPAIVGGGLNSTVLHYEENDQQLVDGDVVCIDSGAFHAGYGADISRTIPVSGTFTKRQKEI